MSRREDLLALGEAELVALANRGLYKRASKELEKGEFELTVAEDGAVTLIQGAVTTQLEPDRILKETRCSCAATGLCRHKLLAILAYREITDGQVEEELWCPGDFCDETLHSHVGTTAWKRALRSRSRGLFLRLQRGGKPVAYLPTCNVSFLVPRNLNYARCDCAGGGPCEHIVLACWAFREKGEAVALNVAKPEVTFDFSAGDKLLERTLSLGLAGLGEGVVGQLQSLSVRYQSQGFLWLSDLLEELAETVRRYQGRSAGFDTLDYSRLLLEWWVRTRSVAKGSPTVLLGFGERPETAVEQTSLTSLGVTIETTDLTSRASLYLAEPNTGVVLVLSRSWPEGLVGHQLLGKRMSGQLTLRRLATGRLVTESAKRRANRELLLGRGRVGKNSIFEDTGDWGERFRWPLLVNDFERLERDLVNWEPTFFRARVQAENVRILEVAEIGEMTYSPGRQTLSLPIYDRSGRRAMLCYVHRRGEPGALSCLAQSVQSGLRFVAGFVTLEGDGLKMEPLSVVGKVCLSPAVASPEELPPDLDFSADPGNDDALTRALDLCLTGAHRGLKFVGQGWREDCLALSQRLLQEGFVSLADELKELGRETTTERWWRASLRACLLLESSAGGVALCDRGV
jgi:SWIM zinc finger